MCTSALSKEGTTKITAVVLCYCIVLYKYDEINKSISNRFWWFGQLVEPCVGRAAPPPPSICKRRFLMIGAPPPPPPIICRRAVDAILVCLFILLHFHSLHDFAIKKTAKIIVQHAYLDNRSSLLKMFWNKYAILENFTAHAALRRQYFGPATRRRRPKLTKAPPPTQWSRRRALTCESVDLKGYLL